MLTWKQTDICQRLRSHYKRHDRDYRQEVQRALCRLPRTEILTGIYNDSTCCQANLQLTLGNTERRGWRKHLLYTYVKVTSVYDAKLQQSLDLLATRGTAEQCGDCYKQTDMVINFSRCDFTHLGYFHL